jgi:bacterioferritin
LRWPWTCEALDGLATRSHAQYGTGTRLEDMLKEGLIAERIAIATDSEIEEEDHADDMAKLLSRVSK